ncbi:hypothetical protein E3T55_19590 [Cryobacterium frigoriphilum]|uniref:Uncharacterized protein n=1 Tax=Cryobacterium frigoriphilum TaxID=1259150 RepID=A0A4V3IQD6_9MICO|nr:hypothetical protein [Cryobacterium frigoriphilum]TFD44999.1 hypothetical protein E3T55_19590 [Cryobacterium frigoriphilum]
MPDDDSHRPWDEAASLAADWIWERSETEGVTPLLVTNTLKSGTFMPVLDDIARRGGHAAPLGKERFDRGPVLAYVPVEKTLKYAMELARGYSLAVVETDSFPLAEWAAGAGAINLLDGSASASEISEDVRHDLDSAIFFGGNNGWTGSHEKNHARSHLLDHVRTRRLSPDDAAAYAMSQGVSDRGARRLRDLLAK